MLMPLQCLSAVLTSGRGETGRACVLPVRNATDGNEAFRPIPHVAGQNGTWTAMLPRPDAPGWRGSPP